MPKRKRIQREHTEDWQTIQQYTLWPEQTAYELLRPIVLFGDPALKRAQETGAAESTLDRKADTFAEQGMVSFFASKPRKQPQETARSLPPDMRQNRRSACRIADHVLAGNRRNLRGAF